MCFVWRPPIAEQVTEQILILVLILILCWGRVFRCMLLTGPAAPSRREALWRYALPRCGAASARFRRMPLHPLALLER
jgi:hypothetical protein